MQYVISFLEGMITFVSPCLLPMLPVYLSYFAGGEQNKKKTILNALGFVLGFTLVFVIMGAFAGTLGAFLRHYKTMVNGIAGFVVILFGLQFLGIFKFLSRNQKHNQVNSEHPMNFGKTILFGMIFSIGWTPCVGAFLGSALMLASSQGSVVQGVLLLLIYSMGLGIPFLVSALLMDQLKSTFNWIKQHYKVVNAVAGGFLILLGFLMMTGWMDKLLSMLSI